MVVARFSWPGVDMAVVSDKQMIKKFGPQVPLDMVRAKSVCILPLKGLQYHRQLKCQDSICFCVSQSCVWRSHTAAGVGHSPQAVTMF